MQQIINFRTRNWTIACNRCVQYNL